MNYKLTQLSGADNKKLNLNKTQKSITFAQNKEQYHEKVSQDNLERPAKKESIFGDALAVF